MTNTRRIQFNGGSYFFTVALERRGSSLLTDRIDDFRIAYAATWRTHPWRCDAFVVIPDHLHAVWTLPEGDADYSTRWRLIVNGVVPTHQMRWTAGSGRWVQSTHPTASRIIRSSRGFGM